MSFRKKISIAFLTKIATIIVSFIVTIIISRRLGTTDYGVYRYILLLITTSYLFSNLGFLESIKQQTSKKILIKDEAFWSGLIFCNGLILVLIFIFILIVSLLNIDIGLSSKYYLALISYLYLFILDKFFFSMLIGIHKVNHFNILTFLKSFVLLCILLILGEKNKLFVLNILYAQEIIMILSGLYILYLIKPKISSIDKTFHAFSLNNTKRAFIIFVSNISTFLSYRVDMFFLKANYNFDSIGIYSVAVLIVEKLWIIPESIRTILFLELVSNKKDAFFVVRITKFTLLLLFIIIIPLIFFSRQFIVLFFGLEYQDSARALIYLLPGIVLFSSSKILSSYFLAIDRVDINMIASISTFVVNIFMNILLISKYGILGAALATSTSYAIGALIQQIIFIRETKIPFWEFIILTKKDIATIFNTIKLLKRKKA